MKGDLKMFVFQKIPSIDLTVDNWSASVREAVPVGVGAPQTVIRTDQAWALVVHFEVIGAATPLIHGQWRIEGYLESMGPGGEFEVPEGAAAMGQAVYNLTLNVPAGLVALAPGEASTPFKLTMTLTAVDELGHHWPMAGYDEGPIILFFVP